MNKLLGWALTLSFLFLWGCKFEEDQGPHIADIWPRGTYPVPSPADGRILFLQEEDPAGLYVLDGDNASRLDSAGTFVRSDYAWSRDATRIAYSSPAASGSARAGIWVSAASDLSALHRVWDRGSHPRFYPNEPFLVCAGPEDASADEGIWQLDFSGNERLQLIDHGVEPEVSPDGFRIAFLMTTGSSMGRTLVIYHRDSHAQDTVAVSVLRHSWLGDSQTLVYETVQNESPEIKIVRPGDDLLGVLIAAGTAPDGDVSSDKFVFAGIDGDRLTGIYQASVSQSVRQISTRGANPRWAGGNRIIAQNANGLIEITF